MMPEFLLDVRVWPGAIVLLSLLLLARIFRSKVFSGLILAALFFHIAFFRDIPPSIPAGDAILSPASGKIVALETVPEGRYLKEEAFRIRIFLAVWNVHVTRSPMDGVVNYQEHVLGKHVNALFLEASQYNESNWIGIEKEGRHLLVRQMTGAVARRIFSDVSVGDNVSRGGKLGIICYGSSVELFVPKRLFTPSVQVGDRVSTGETVIGSWLEERQS